MQPSARRGRLGRRAGQRACALACAALLLVMAAPGGAQRAYPTAGAGASLPARPQSAAVSGQALVLVESPLPEPLADSVREAVAEEMSRLGIPGMSVAIGLDGQLRLAAGFGHADVENDTPATAETVYRFASVSKPITAVAALQQAERGRLDLSAPVWRYCAAFPAKPWPVTTRQLLCHQGGIRGYRPGEMNQTRAFASVSDGLALFKDDPLAYEPGTSVFYTTFGYSVVGCVVEGAAERPFAEVLHESVFAPAGMVATGPENLRALVPHRAAGYVRSANGELLNSRFSDVSYKVPGGGLCGTAPDVARFGLALLSGELLGRATLQQMLAPQRLRGGRQTGFGLGLTVGLRNGRREAWHTGGQERVSTLLYLRPDSGLVIAVLSNLERVQSPLLELGRRLADMVSAERVHR